MRVITPGLVVVGVAAVGVGVWAVWPRTLERPETASGPSLVWVFEAPHPGSVVASPLATSEALYLPVIHHDRGRASGAVYAIDPRTGKSIWNYPRDEAMLPSVSTPALGEDLLY